MKNWHNILTIKLYYVYLWSKFFILTKHLSSDNFENSSLLYVMQNNTFIGTLLFFFVFWTLQKWLFLNKITLLHCVEYSQYNFWKILTFHIKLKVMLPVENQLTRVTMNHKAKQNWLGIGRTLHSQGLSGDLVEANHFTAKIARNIKLPLALGEAYW